MKTIRIWFYKKDTARYISNLDVLRLMQRAIKKAKLPFWYTEGFNPHVFVTVNMPISLGYTGLKESLDVKLLEDDFPFEEITLRLNKVLPKDIQVFSVSEAQMKSCEMAFSSYEIRIENENDLLNKAKSFLEQDEILVAKKTKKGMKEVDIKENFKDMQIKEEGSELVFLVTLQSSNNGSINPRLFFDALFKKYDLSLYQNTTRTGSFDAKMNEFC